MLATTTLLNRVGADLAGDRDVHAITDVTGFGLIGHALELARGSGLSLMIRAKDVPLLAQAARLAQEGFVTGASHRNWASYGEGVALPADGASWLRDLLTDPQTSGGLLVACAPHRASEIVAQIRSAGYPSAQVIGTAEAGSGTSRVTIVS
jgi:selenide,water dikinase